MGQVPSDGVALRSPSCEFRPSRRVGQRFRSRRRFVRRGHGEVDQRPASQLVDDRVQGLVHRRMPEQADDDQRLRGDRPATFLPYCAPRSTKLASRPEVRFHTVTGWSASRNRLARALPIAPSPSIVTPDRAASVVLVREVVCFIRSMTTCRATYFGSFFAPVPAALMPFSSPSPVNCFFVLTLVCADSGCCPCATTTALPLCGPRSR